MSRGNEKLKPIGHQTDRKISEWGAESQPSATVKAEQQATLFSHYSIAIDAVLIPGLPNPEKHCLAWHDVKLAVVFDPRKIKPGSYVAGSDQVEAFGDRLWHHLQSRGLAGEDFRLALGDGADWIWNLVDLHFPRCPNYS